MDECRKQFEAWWDNFSSAHEDWRFADSEALRWQAWQAWQAAWNRRAEPKAAGTGEQEPVAWMSPGKERLEFSRKGTVYGSHTIPLYTTPPTAALTAYGEQVRKALIEKLLSLGALGDGEYVEKLSTMPLPAPKGGAA